MERIVVLGSGGINSTVAAARAKADADVHLLFFDYGQGSAAARRRAVHDLADHLRSNVTVVDLPHVAQVQAIQRPGAANPASADSLLSGDGEPSSIPGLATAMLSVGYQFARRIGATALHAGSSELADELESESGPGSGAADHRREFFYLASLTFEQLHPGRMRVAVETPLIDLPRDEIIRLGMRFNTPFDLTWSCDRRDDVPCGVCRGCMSRAKAFAAANLADPPKTATASAQFRA